MRHLLRQLNVVNEDLNKIQKDMIKGGENNNQWNRFKKKKILSLGFQDLQVFWLFLQIQLKLFNGSISYEITVCN